MTAICTTMFIALYEEMPTGRNNLLDFIDDWYAATVYVPHLLGSAGIEDKGNSLLTYYDSMFIAIILAVLYLLYQLIRKIITDVSFYSEPYTFSFKSIIIFGLLVCISIMMVYLSLAIESTKIINVEKAPVPKTIYFTISNFLGILVSMLAILFFIDEDLNIKNFILYLLFTSSASLVLISISLLRGNLFQSLLYAFAVSYFTTWYFFSIQIRNIKLLISSVIFFCSLMLFYCIYNI